MAKTKVIAVVGPTASGKSALGVYLAQQLDGEIISADSRQVYKGLDLGTGKVTKKEMGGVPHHLLSVISPKKQFSVDDYLKRGQKALSHILENKRIPMIVGGTGLYIDALVGRLAIPEVPPNPELRSLLEKKTAAQLFADLELRDPRRAATVEPHHKRRLIRALEIAAALGRSPSLEEARRESPYDILWLGLRAADATLRKKIHKRLTARLRAGMVAEAKRLHAQGVSYARMEELGLEYRYLAQLLQGKLSRAEFEAQLEAAINRYAKRQMRWFHRNKDIHWLTRRASALRLVKQFLKS